MNTYKITHTCGHNQRHDLKGNDDACESKAEWLITTVCSDCYRNQKKIERQAEWDAENAASAEINVASDLPALTGTPRQIAWAETLRTQAISQMCDGHSLARQHIVWAHNQAQYAIYKGDVDAAEQLESEIANTQSYIFKQAEAKWWIDKYHNAGYHPFYVIYNAATVAPQEKRKVWRQEDREIELAEETKQREQEILESEQQIAAEQAEDNAYVVAAIGDFVLADVKIADVNIDNFDTNSDFVASAVDGRTATGVIYEDAVCLYIINDREVDTYDKHQLMVRLSADIFKFARPGATLARWAVPTSVTD